MGAILVTGGAGYIGSHTSKLLLKKGYDVVILDSLELGHREVLDFLPGAKFVPGDIGDGALVSQTIKDYEVDSAIHFAAYASVPESVAQPVKYYQNNIVKTLTLFDALVEGGVKHGELGEDHTPETHMIPLTLFAALGRRPDIKMFGSDYPTPDGTGIRDYIHVTDLGTAHVLGLEALKNGAETTAYNLGTGKGYSVKEVVEMGRKVTGKDIVATEAPRRPGDPAELVATSAKIEKELGWKPQFGDLETIMRTACEWFEKHPNGYKG